MDPSAAMEMMLADKRAREVSRLINDGLHDQFCSDPTIIGTRAHGCCPSCKLGDAVKYGHVELPRELVVVLGCVRCRCRWMWQPPAAVVAIDVVSVNA
jgi:hypothetical protein